MIGRHLIKMEILGIFEFRAVGKEFVELVMGCLLFRFFSPFLLLVRLSVCFLFVFCFVFLVCLFRFSFFFHLSVNLSFCSLSFCFSSLG